MDIEDNPYEDTPLLGVDTLFSDGNVSQTLTAFEEAGKPHYGRLVALQENEKVPKSEQARILKALERYQQWVETMDSLTSTGSTRINELVELLNAYKYYVEFDLIFDSPNDFLYRQAGQLKLASTIMEEFLPRLADERIVPELQGKVYSVGPKPSFAAAYFRASLSNARQVGLTIRTKDQDFTVGRAAYLQASFDERFPATNTAREAIYLAFIAAECKTNLDKTMWQEAIATAHDLRVAVPGSRYFLLCEWLDMPPGSTEGTDIQEVIILRGKRITSNVRKRFASYAGRQESRDFYSARLKKYPIRSDMIRRFVQHMRDAFRVPESVEGEVLRRGYF